MSEFENSRAAEDPFQTFLADKVFHDYPVTDFIEDVYRFKVKDLRSPSQGYKLSWEDATDYSAGQYCHKGERSAHVPLVNLLKDLMTQVQRATGPSLGGTDIQLFNASDRHLASDFAQVKPDLIWGWMPESPAQEWIVTALGGILKKSPVKKKTISARIDLTRIAPVRVGLQLISSTALT